MNEIIFFLSILAAFSSVVLVARFFGKHGLIAWVAVGTIMANLVLPKCITLFGMQTTLGSIMFSSTYLCTDIICEVYGERAGKRAVLLGLVSVLTYIFTTQFALWYRPNEMDFVNGAMKDLFSITLRISVASVVMYFIANLADVYLFAALKRRFPKALWLRNNVATIVCNCGENFLFGIGAFLGVFTLTECIQLALVGSLFEIIISICDTPFVYLGRAACRKYEETRKLPED